jgi:CDP-diacylglycerol--serine O-phosphatidyltransferase
MEASLSLSLIGAALTASAGLLMVSNFKYPSFKEVDLRGKVPFMMIFAVAMGFVVITIDPPRILFAMAVIFGFSAPLIWLAKKLGFQAAPKD